MWGAVIGDLAGSVYEYHQSKRTTLIDVTNLMDEKSFFSDDTILTMAVYDAILHDKDYEKYLRMYGKRYLDYKPSTGTENYFASPFSRGFVKWLTGEGSNTSIGNGAMMRISGVGFMFDYVEDVIQNARAATIPSHNSKEAVECATKVALVIYYARMGMSKGEIYNQLGLKSVAYKPFHKFNTSCSETIDNCLYAVFTSSNFEEAIKKVIGFGGDTDTNACIVGAMAESLYGIPSYFIHKARRKLPEDFVKILDKAYELKK